MVQIYVGVTDGDWFEFLAARRLIESINFWQPGGQTQFKAVQPGELFLFKLRAREIKSSAGGKPTEVWLARACRAEGMPVP